MINRGSLKALSDPSALVRSAAADGLAGNPTPETARALLRSTSDDFRVVRVRAATAFGGFPRSLLKDQDLSSLKKATQEYLHSLLSRPDLWSSHYNLGNFLLGQGKPKLAVLAFETASKLYSMGIPPLVNLSIAYAREGQFEKANEALKRALDIQPKDATANFNMGLLKAEQNDTVAAEQYLRTALDSDPKLGEAAYNLSVILAKDRLDEAVNWANKAAELRPKEPKYAYTLGFFYNRKGSYQSAVNVLQGLIGRHPAYAEAYFLLGEVYEKQGNRKDAENVYRKAISQVTLSPPVRQMIEERLEKLEPN